MWTGELSPSRLQFAFARKFLSGESPRFVSHCLHIIPGLLDERAHRQAVHEAARQGGLVRHVHRGLVEGREDAVPQPREDDGGGFAEAGGDFDQSRMALGAVR